jgi:hypothetical protein
MDLRSGAKRVLEGINKVDGLGPAFAKRPSWTADGQRIPMALEVFGASLTSEAGTCA